MNEREWENPTSILKSKAMWKYASVHMVVLKITQILTVDWCTMNSEVLQQPWHKRAALRYKV